MLNILRLSNSITIGDITRTLIHLFKSLLKSEKIELDNNTYVLLFHTQT